MFIFAKDVSSGSTEGQLKDFQTSRLKEIKLSKVGEEWYLFTKFIAKALLSTIIHTLDQSLSIMGQKTRCKWSSKQFLDLVENQIVFQKPRVALVDFIMQAVTTLLQVIVGKNTSCLINAHATTPDKYITTGIKGHAVVIASYKINYGSGGLLVRCGVNKLDFFWFLSN